MGLLTPFNTPFLLHNHVVWSKIGCLQKKLEVKRLKFEGMAEIFTGDHIFHISEIAEKFAFQKNLKAPFSKLGVFWILPSLI